MFAERALRAKQRTYGTAGVRIKTIALPAEHGGWGLLFEPMMLGLFVAPSVAGLYLALSALGFFLARHPLTVVILNRGRVSPRTAMAKRFVLLYLTIGTASFIAALIFTRNSFILPLVFATPLALLQVSYDWTGRRRRLLSELAGVVAISSLAPALALSDGWPLAMSLTLWLIMVARAAPAIVYVRACLARRRQRTTSPLGTLAIHLLAIVAVGYLASTGLAPRMAVAAMIVLLVRAAIGFTLSPRFTPKQLGFSEIAFGGFAVIAIAMGTALGI
jgi:hypothetical protein